ncbi:MAG: hypothetical protein ACR2PG_19620 [Hyphomicrobiaceae bacterium]
MPRARINSRICVAVFVVGSLVSACAGQSNGPVSAGLGGNCKSLKMELSKYEARGIQYKADAAGRGAKLSAKQRDEVDRYNNLLDSYLGNSCHA